MSWRSFENAHDVASQPHNIRRLRQEVREQRAGEHAHDQVVEHLQSSEQWIVRGEEDQLPLAGENVHEREQDSEVDNACDQEPPVDADVLQRIHRLRSTSSL